MDKKHIEETYYEVLNIKENANFEEIRASYRSAALTLYPDKLLNTSISNIFGMIGDYYDYEL